MTDIEFYLILSLLFIIFLLANKIIKLKEENRILYNNYQTSLKILGEYDPKLKAYLERK
jgi:hypothetical protein|nr:MAG TPA: hypothetical protein [Caudoviricetes sp.]